MGWIAPETAAFLVVLLGQEDAQVAQIVAGGAGFDGVA